jgi:hypothetical protein
MMPLAALSPRADPVSNPTPPASVLDSFDETAPRVFGYCWDKASIEGHDPDAACSKTAATHATDVSGSGQISGYDTGFEGGPIALVWLPYSPDQDTAIEYLPTEAPIYGARADLIPGDGIPVLGVHVFGGSYAYDIDASGTGGAAMNVVGSIVHQFEFAPTIGGGGTVNVNGFVEPVIWSGGSGAWGQPTVLPLPSTVPGINGEIPYVGEALAINDAGTHIAGWIGAATQDGDPDHYTSTPQRLDAVRWTYASGSWTGELLGLPPLFDDTQSTVATDINGDGTVIGGWFGSPVNPPVSNGFGIHTDIFGGPFEARPFIWTETSGFLTPLLLPNAIPQGSGEIYGAVRAVNSPGNVAVGWTGTLVASGNPFGRYWAARWQDDQPGADLLLAPSELMDFGVTVTDNIAGTVANAVDVSGNVVVGQVDYFTPYYTREVGNRDDILSQAMIWDAANDYAPQLLSQVLVDHGVDLDGFFLTRANAIRVTYNDEGQATDFVVIGDGFVADGDDPMFIAHIGPNSGVITLPDLLDSLHPVPDLPVVAATEVSNTLQGLGDFAENRACFRPRGADPAAKPWCWFTFGSGSWFRSDDYGGTEFLGDIGIARLDEDHPENSAALTAGLSKLHADFGSGAALDGFDIHAGGYLAHQPHDGWQLFGAGVVSLFTGVDIKRVYPNGGGTDTSSGSTNGNGWGLLGKVGYALHPNDVTTLTPFASLTYAQSRFAAFTETGGAFPASFAATAAGKSDLRLGVSGKRILDDERSLFGSVAWAHRLGGWGGIAVADFLFADCDGSSPMTAFCGISASAYGSAADWLELLAGYRRELSNDAAFTASVGGSFASNYAAITGRLGYAQAF